MVKIQSELIGNYKKHEIKNLCDNILADQDSDSIYVTNQHEIVQWAKYCQSNYPTIVNNIPKSSKKYSLSMDSYALIDTNLAKSQNAIGESSNIAQLAQTYASSFGDKKYRDAVCILSVLAQVA